MATLGTKKFWKPSPDGSAPRQILKTSGYITVAVQAVHCNREGKTWSSIAGTSDTVAITSRLTYRREDTTVEHTVVHGLAQAGPDQFQVLATPRTLALKVPTDADSLEMSIEMRTIEKETQRSVVAALNTTEFQKPLELTPRVVGEVAFATAFLKRCIVDVNPKKTTVATFPGIISGEVITNLTEDNLLMTGQLIVMSTQDDVDKLIERAAPDNMTIDGNTLRFNGKEVRGTYLVFNVSVDTYRGYNTTANWYNIFQESLVTLNDLMLTKDETEREQQYQTSVKLWLEAGALLQNDPTYIQPERDKIKQDYLDQIITKFNRVHRPVAIGAEGRSILRAPMNVGRRINDITVAYHVPTGLSKVIDFKNMPLEELQRSARTYRDMVKRLN